RREVKVDTRERRPEAATRVWVPLSKSMGLQAPTLEIFEALSISGLDRTRATSGVGPTKDRSLSARVSASSSPAEGPLRSAVPCRKAVRGLRADVAATDTIAAHCEARSPRCSLTISTARSCTSGENFGLCCLSIAPISQRREPPTNPERRHPKSRRSRRSDAHAED